MQNNTIQDTEHGADDGLLAGPELESEAELIALGILKAPEPVPELVSFNIRDYLTMADETVVWQMPYLAPSGCITLLVGSPGAGKTTFFWALLSEGLQFGTMLGEQVVPGFTAQILTEERPATFRQAIVNVKLDGQLILGQTRPPWTITPRDYQKSKDWGQIVDLLGDAWINDTPPDLLFVDPIGKWAGVEDWNSYADALRAIGPLQALSAAFPHTAIVAAHHARKSGGSAVDAALGSVGITGAVDNTVAFDAPDAGDPNMRRLRYTGRIVPNDLAFGEKWIRWDESTGLYGHARKGAAHEELIRELLNEAPSPLTTAEILEGTEWPGDTPSPQTIRRALRHMMDADIVRCEGTTKGGKRWWLGTDAAPTC